MKGEKTVILIAGPTAVGKTTVAVQVAKHFNTEIISADSRQCFRELKIGVARPSEEELSIIPHHFIATHSIHDKVTAATFEEYALTKAHQVFQNRNVVVLTGGTGLYIKAFTDGFDDIPEIPQNIRTDIIDAYKREGAEWLKNELKKADPVFYEKGEIENPQRCMRALEVVRFTGTSILEFRNIKPKQRPFDILKLALELPKEQLHQNINNRVDIMMKDGLIHEVESLKQYQDLNALQTVGYKELFKHLQGETSLAEAIDQIKTNTRQYAKRQVTWFKKDKELRWLPPSAELVTTEAEKFFSQQL